MAKRLLFDGRLSSWLAVVLLSCWSWGALAQQADPPGRVAFVSLQQGSVVFAPLGAEDWQQLPPNRPLTEGDRLWTDPAARAELQLGTATLHLGSVTQLRLGLLEERVARFVLQQGTANARVRDLQPDEDFEIDTPNLALRVLQPGDYRLDVEPRTQRTRIIVRSGQVDVFGENGQAVRMAAGQQATFSGRALAQVEAPYAARDEFGLWAEERNRAQDQALAARYVPRGVVGATELDAWGNWAEDPGYGVVWYPTVTLVNWAPYRYGHWDWIPPWGWTWIDDAPWGFAPFHYGRWAMIGQRWAWVPGRLPPRPVYAPALVVFFGGGGTFILGSGPAVGWYPLAPDEAWWPWYHASARYVSHANPAIRLGASPRDATDHYWRQHPFAVTAVREDEFRRGRPVDRAWRAVAPAMIDRARVGVVPARPQDRPARVAAGTSAPPLYGTLPKPVQTILPPPHGAPGVPPLPPAVRDQLRAQQEQDRLQRQAERDARHQIREQYESEAQRQRNAGRVDSGQPQRDAGKVDYGRSQRDAGRVQIDQGGNFDSGQGHRPRDPDEGRGARPRSR